MGSTATERGVIRRLSVFDHDAFTQHLLRLDAESRYLRFGMATSDAFLIDYSRGCSRWDVVIYGYFVDDILRGAAELRPLGGLHTNEAEVAFSVEKDCRGHGIGTRLFEKIIRAARNRSYVKLYMSCLATNLPMQALARRFTAEILFDRGGTVGIIQPEHRTAQTMADESSDDADAYVLASLDLPGHSMSDPLGWFNSRG
ncbi:MAG: GNAT family N-acetyltransferase [Proteobacteria bacterium]|nr:GNAT family N-acetyltransferase [Pseudomonadota bacterium]